MFWATFGHAVARVNITKQKNEKLQINVCARVSTKAYFSFVSGEVAENIGAQRLFAE